MSALFDVVIMSRDGRTQVHDLAVTDEQLSTLRWLVSVVEPASRGDYKPTLTIERSPERPVGTLCTECWEQIPADARRVRDDLGDWVHDTCREEAS